MKRKMLAYLLVLVGSLLVVGVASAAVGNYRAHLSGRFEIPAVVDTQAQGEAVLQSNDDGSLSYKLNVANIENVLMAHIHIMPVSGSGNGPIIVWLYPSAPPAQLIPGRFDGKLASGTLTDSSVGIDYNGDGHKDLSDLLDAINAGDTYVNVHTSANPAGEIHGPVH